MGAAAGVSEVEKDTSSAIKSLGSLFTLSQVYLRDDCYTATRDSGCLHDEETKDDMELSKQLSALGLPISFRTSKATRNVLVQYKKKDINQRHLQAHEGNEAHTEKFEIISSEEEYSDNLTSSATFDAIEEPEFYGVTSDFSVDYGTALYSESSEVCDNDESNSKISDESEIWALYWDSFYSRYYFYNTRTNESTWDPPPGMEHLTFCEVKDKPNETIGDDIVEILGSHCSVGSFEKDDQLLDHSSCEPCWSFELAGENLHNSTSTLNYSSESLNEEEELKKSCISTLCYNSENLNEEQELKKSYFEEKLLQLLPDYMDRAEDKLEEKGIGNIVQNPMNFTLQEEETEDVREITKKKKKARKRTRLNKKLSIGSGELHFQGILEECPSQQKDILELSPSISKYWCQRYQLFSKFDNGIKMDEEGWFSATPEPIAKYHAFRCGDGVVIDCFTGVGGNAIQFAQRSKHVIAVDIDPKKIEYAQHNAAIYGVSDHIDFVVGDSFILAPRLKADTVFLSPPWGGPNYFKATSYDVNTMLKPHGGIFLFNAVKGIASKVVMFLPRTADLNQLAELSLSADPPWSLEVERNFLNGRLKAITAYFTDMSI